MVQVTATYLAAAKCPGGQPRLLQHTTSILNAWQIILSYLRTSDLVVHAHGDLSAPQAHTILIGGIVLATVAYTVAAI